MPIFSTANIPYHEYRAISELRRNHPEIQRGKLRAMIAFGPLIANGESYDINLLEVMEGWQGPRQISYGSSSDLPLRGQLHLYFLTPDEFEHPQQKPLPQEQWSSAGLLARVLPAYAIMLEEPNDYAREVMARLESAPLVVA